MNGPALRDIHIPAASWWPPAPGWWLVAAVVVLAALAIGWWLHRRAARAPLRAALREIDALQTAWQRDHDTAASVDAASRLMRRVAVRVDPVAAAQPGTAWHAFVQRYARDPRTQRALDGMLAMRFRAPTELAVPELWPALRAWCRVAFTAPRTAAGAIPGRSPDEVPAR